MKRNITLWQFFGFVAVSLLGTILHFLYDWTGMRSVALFSAVNESTWEHMKLIFFPMFVYAIFQSFFLRKGYAQFWCIKLKGTLIGMLLIPVLFYTIRGSLGATPDWVNIAIFFVSAAVAYIYETKQFKKGSKKCRFEKIAFVILCFIAASFAVFTFAPPEFPLFKDPVDGGYGIK